MGLDYLHRICNIIHTEIKPENILLTLTQTDLEAFLKQTNMAKQKSYIEKLKDFRKRHLIKAYFDKEWGKENILID